jgi:3-deoxy-D-manno-octulosonic-acid transferase
VYACIARILAISPGDAARFARCAPGHSGISVTGDTRFDRVMERWNQRASTRINLPEDGNPTLIAGSTWPADETHLLPALERLLDENQRLRVVLVPHEPTPAHIEPLRRWGARFGVRALSDERSEPGEQSGAARVVILDAVGVLAEAYRHAQVAYVGGAFSTGVHSVIEPAIAGIPVVFGPRHDNSFEAQQLIEHGAATAGGSAEQLHAALAHYLGDESQRQRAGAAARAYVESQLGATEKCMAALSAYL